LKTFVFLLLALFPITTASARIGETFGECQARYGVMIGTDVTNPVYAACVFRKDGIEIRVRFYNGTSAQELFFGIESELTQPQMREIEAASLASGVPARGENLSPSIDEQRLRVLGVKISQVTRQTRLTPCPVGINGENGRGMILVITTPEFEHVLSGTNGF
jgi:hypothetical protein